MKDVTFWAADAWNAMKLCLKKSLCPLLYIIYELDPTQNIVKTKTQHWKNFTKKYQDVVM